MLENASSLTPPQEPVLHYFEYIVTVRLEQRKSSDDTYSNFSFKGETNQEGFRKTLLEGLALLAEAYQKQRKDVLWKTPK